MSRRLSRVPKLLVRVLLLAAVSAVASADFKRGMDLWDRGKLAEATAEFRRGADAGDARAQDQLGIMYEEGQGVAEDPPSAAFWYEKAAVQGYAPAQLNLARLYRNGKGVARDESRAVHWYTQAAEGGLAIAQFFLGLMYDTGKGVPHDPMRAYMWFSLAAAQGDQDALLKRDRLAKRLDEAQMREAARIGSRHGDMGAPKSTRTDTAHTRPLPATYDKPAGSAPSVSAPRPAIAVPPSRALSRSEVRDLQRQLRALGFAPGPADGRPGPRTQAAVRALERARGTAVTGALTLASLELARAPAQAVAPASSSTQVSDATSHAKGRPASAPPPRPARIPARGRALVREIQRQLAWLGFGPGPVDGLVGKRTVQAARDYERANGRRVTGKLTPNLLRTLLETSTSQAPRRAPKQTVSTSAGRPPLPALVAPATGKRVSPDATRLPLAPSVPTKPLASVQSVPRKVEPAPQPEARTQPDPYKLRGAALVREFQRELARLGYDIGPIDGVIGKQTVNAAKAFQQGSGVRRTGKLTPSLLKRMQIARTPESASPAAARAPAHKRAQPVPAPSNPRATSVPRRAAAVSERDEGELRPGGTALVLAIQRSLNRLGYRVGIPDGVVGSRTVGAAQQFQRATGRRPTGVLGDTLLRALNAAVSKGALSRVAVREIQARLNERGYAVGPADGLVGSKTIQAVRAYQQRNGISPDGRLSRELLDALRSAGS